MYRVKITYKAKNLLHFDGFALVMYGSMFGSMNKVTDECLFSSCRMYVENHVNKIKVTN